MDSFELLNKQQQDDIKNAIKLAELDTSGEIRVHIENVCNGDLMDRVSTIFEKLKMHKTQHRNGVLFYLALKNRKFAVLGDKGINNAVCESFWDDVKEKLLFHFREERFIDGLVEGIDMAGKQLQKFFPYQTEDQNELSDEISFENN